MATCSSNLRAIRRNPNRDTMDVLLLINNWMFVLLEYIDSHNHMIICTHPVGPYSSFHYFCGSCSHLHNSPKMANTCLNIVKCIYSSLLLIVVDKVTLLSILFYLVKETGIAPFWSLISVKSNLFVGNCIAFPSGDV